MEAKQTDRFTIFLLLLVSILHLAALLLVFLGVSLGTGVIGGIKKRNDAG